MVLIENQLEESDHGHLGQILTYLAGTEAQTIVWVAPKFADAHLSAIRWLNERTVDPFSFFAVEVSVVRIGNSPVAPIFDIVERPNGWVRTVQQQTRETRQLSSVGEFRKAFWAHLVARHPDEQAAGSVSALSWRWRRPTSSDLVVAQYVGQNSVGVFVRGKRGVSAETTMGELAAYQDQLERELAVPIGETYFYFKKLSIDTADRGNWDRMADWLHNEADAYVAILERVVAGGM
jgi:hypothetical protein